MARIVIRLVLIVMLSACLPEGLVHGAEREGVKGGQDMGQEVVMELVPIRNRPAADMLQTVQSALSPQGRVSLDKVSNTLLIFDTAEQLIEMKKLIKTLDRQVPQVTVSIRYKRVDSPSRTLSTRGLNTGQGRVLSTGTVRRQEQMMLRIASGSTGYIQTGKEVPFDEYWLELCGRYGYRFGWFSRYRRVETGFEVQPVVFGDRVDLTLYPRLSFDEDRALVFSEAVTRTTLPLETWVPVAMTDSAAEAVVGVIGIDEAQPVSGMIMEVKVRVHQPE